MTNQATFSFTNGNGEVIEVTLSFDSSKLQDVARDLANRAIRGKRTSASALSGYVSATVKSA